MSRRANSGMYALLGLLTISPMSGYDLAQNVKASIGHMWSESFGQIYPNLKKLAAAGLVECETERQKGKPDRNLYTITAKGRERLGEWLATAPQPEVPRNEMLLKLFFGTQVRAEVLMGYVEAMVETHRALLERFRHIEEEEIPELERYPDAPYWLMTARFGQLEMQAHLQWAEETLASLRVLAARQKDA